MTLTLNHIPKCWHIVPPKNGDTTELECLSRSNRAHPCPAVKSWTEMLRRGIHATSRQIHAKIHPSKSVHGRGDSLSYDTVVDPPASKMLYALTSTFCSKLVLAFYSLINVSSDNFASIIPIISSSSNFASVFKPRHFDIPAMSVLILLANWIW